MPIVLIFAFLLLAYATPVSAGRPIKTDEYIQFFNTNAHFDREAETWQLQIHGWVYELEPGFGRHSLFKHVVKSLYGLSVDDNNRNYVKKRVDLLIADNERNKQVAITLCDRRYVLPDSKPNGHFYARIAVPLQQLYRCRSDNGIIRFDADLPSGDTREFRGEIQLVLNAGLSVISDIDDTIKISNVTDRAQLLENTFYKPFKAVPGMSQVYRHFVSRGATVHFVSSSPFQLYSPLRSFTRANHFPWASFSLKHFRFRDKTFFNLFKKGTETKPAQIRSILNRFPDRHFILIGDNGEEDPEVYAEIVEAYPHRIAGFAIRNVAGEALTDNRYQQLLSDVLLHSQFLLFDHPDELKPWAAQLPL